MILVQIKPATHLKLVFVFWLVCPLLVPAQSSYFPFENFTSRDQFPDSYISGILQDRRGFIWIASNEGLTRYDGISFEVYKHDNNNQHSLADNNINAIVMDHDGIIWVATKNGISCYDSICDCFDDFYHDASDSQSLSDNQVWSLATDRAGNVWAGTVNEGLNKIVKEIYTDKNDERKIRYRFISFKADTNDASSLSDNYVLSLYFDSFNNGWVGTRKGLNRFSDKDGNSKKILFSHFHTNDHDSNALSHPWVWNICGDPRGNIWLSTYYGVDVIPAEQAKNNPSQAKIIHTLALLNNVSHGDVSIVYNLMVDSRNNLWIGTEKRGVIKAAIKFDWENQTIGFDSASYYLHDDANPQSLVFNNVRSFYEDRTGVIWVGTERGVSRYIPSREDFNELHLNEQQKILKTDVTAVFADKKDIIWIGGNGNGIWSIRGRVISFHPFPKVRELNGHDSINIVNSICRSKGGDLYVGTIYGLFVARDKDILECMNGAAGNFYFTWAKPFDIEGNEIQIQSIIEDTFRNIWTLGEYKLSKFNLDHSENKINYSIYDPESDKKELTGRTLLTDRSDHVWVGTDDGLLSIGTNDKQVIIYHNIPGDSESLSNNEINCLFKDSRGKFWIGTANGLNWFNPQTKKFTSYSLQNGLSDANIRAICEDKNGRLWLTTKQGLSMLELTSMKFTNFDQQDGLNAAYFNVNAITTTGNHLILAGSNHGVNSFDPDKIPFNTVPPNVFLTDFSILGKSIFSSQATERSNVFRARHTITLCPGENQFTVDFAALNFINTAKNAYTYRLQGFDRDWIYAGNNHSATYTNLNGGNYTFEVKASNNNGVWNNNPVMLSIHIIPPWYQRWWFYSLLALIFAAIIFLVYKVRINQLLKLQTIRNRIASDLHDEIGSTLNSISVFSEVAKQKSITATAELDEIGESSRHVIDAMSDIVWTINPANDSLDKIILRMRSLLHELMRAKGIEYTFHVEENLRQLKLPMLTRKNFYLIFKEALNNMVKYSQANEAWFELNFSDHRIHLQMEDNGVGFDLGNAKQGNGLMNMRKRAEEIKATLTIDSLPGKGTKINLTFKAE